MKRRSVDPRHIIFKPSAARGWHPGLPLLIALCLFALGDKTARAQTAPQPHATVKLVSERNALLPGGSSWIGLLFHLDQGWHIYWENPGDSGEPPKVQWALPPGFSVTEIRWPTPVRLGAPPVVDYGYEGQVLLMSALTAPSGSQTDSPVTVSADVRYIVCREICVPGKSHLTLSLPAAANSSAPCSPWRGLFQQTRAQLSRPVPTGWKISSTSRGNQFIISVRTQVPVQTAAFFPSEPNVIENAAPQPFASSSHGFRLTLEKSQLLVKLPTTLKGLMQVNSGAAYLVSFPVIPGSH
jgi:DsbC/DsbD-like thiol-disulfide interchange protein